MADGKRIGRLGVREIARQVGVAPMTVSRVLSNPDLVAPATRAKVLEAIERAGFVPNRLASSMRGAGRMIGHGGAAADQLRDRRAGAGHVGRVRTSAATRCSWSRATSPPQDEEEAVRTLLGWRPAGMILQSFVQSETAPGAPGRRAGWRWSRSRRSRGGRRSTWRVGVSNFETAYAMTDASGAQGLPADRLRLDAGARQRPAAAAAHRLSRGAGGARAARTTDMEVEVTDHPARRRGGAGGC